MIKLIKWLYWELKNEFVACGYFTAMLLMYGIIKLIDGDRNIDILIIFEMFLVNYLLATLQKIFLDGEKDYTAKNYIVRGTALSIISLITVIAVSKIGGWFDGLPFWADITIYIMLILSYLTVWIILNLGRRYDTQKLNEQLANFKKNRRE
jgi:hypothetical protein